MIDDAQWLLKKSGKRVNRKLDRQLLAVYLNFANGSFGLDELFDTDFDGVVDADLSTIVTDAESVRLNPASSKAQRLQEKRILEAINKL